jgi:large subunit ribosomal protein L22
MAEEIKHQHKETKEIVEKVKEKVAEAKILPQEKHTEHKHAQEPKKEVKLVKKDEAIANALSIHASKKHCMYICNFIKGKKIDDAIKDLNEVIKLKRAIPFKGEIPHRKGMHSGRYPISACKLFIPLLKGLRGNAIVNQMDLDKARITYACSNWASRPQRRGGVKAKRAHVLLKARETQGDKK